MTRLVALVVSCLVATPAFAQLVEPNQIGVRMGHVHLAVKDVEAQKRFWIGAIGGTLVKNGGLELISSPAATSCCGRPTPPRRRPAPSSITSASS